MDGFPPKIRVRRWGPTIPRLRVYEYRGARKCAGRPFSLGNSCRFCLLLNLFINTLIKFVIKLDAACVDNTLIKFVYYILYFNNTNINYMVKFIN